MIWNRKFLSGKKETWQSEKLNSLWKHLALPSCPKRLVLDSNCDFVIYLIAKKRSCVNSVFKRRFDVILVSTTFLALEPITVGKWRHEKDMDYLNLHVYIIYLIYLVRYFPPLTEFLLHFTVTDWKEYYIVYFGFLPCPAVQVYYAW